MSTSIHGIPSLDLNDFLSGDPRLKAGFVNKLGKAFEEFGFVAIRNHGLDPILTDELYRLVQQFFSLPDTIKSKYEIEELSGQRGYTSFGKEHAKGSNAGDLKEFWHFGQETERPENYGYPENIICEEIPGFHEKGMGVYRQLEDCGVKLLRAISLYLDLPEHYFDAWVKDGNSILRPIHYPPITAEPGSSIRAGAHEDINLITLLMGASAEGLEILDKKNQWVPVTAVEGHLVVNVGDMLERLTNRKLRSTTHRVVNPPREKWHLPRYSMPFFLHPQSEMPLNGLPGCISHDHPKYFEDCTAGDFLTERLREIGLIK